MITFKNLEHQGWNERAEAYDTFTARFTNYGIGPLLQTTGALEGLTLLDVCCGTGLATHAAAQRGAHATGIDISENMVALAKAKCLDCVFQIGDAESLPFNDHVLIA